ncbi:MAG: hypothetical protein M3164_04015 [Actinomycetota bacterium]|nr:hypothetical protein [Actinomycetota bacterium]
METDRDDVIEGVGEPAEQSTLAEPPSDDLDREGLSAPEPGGDTPELDSGSSG